MLEVKPVGYIEITSNGSRFMPITDSSAIAIRAVTMEFSIPITSPSVPCSIG